jgi:hypothetical protein
VLLLSIFAPWSVAGDGTSGKLQLKKRFYPVRNVAAEEVSKESAQPSVEASARWKELKSRDGLDEDYVRPKVKAVGESRPVQASSILPFPEDFEDSTTGEAGLLDHLDGEIAPTPPQPQVIRPRKVRAEVQAPIFEEDSSAETDDDAPAQAFPRGFPRLAAQPDPAPADAEKTTSEAESTEENMEEMTDPAYKASPAFRRPRQISEISPRYDVSIDEDIRKFAQEQAVQYGVSLGHGAYPPRMFPGTVYEWEPSNFYHYPLYFEDPQLERYGHTYGHIAQPIASLARFGGQLVLLPYQMTLDPICTKQYSLGWYRPGECAPKLHYQFPLNAHAAFVQAAVVTGIFFAIP